MNPGEIRWVDLPQTAGHEQAGRRPAIIVQDDAYAGALPVTLVVPFTSAQAAARLPGTLLIQPTPENGLRQPSVVLVFQVRSTDRHRIHEQLGVIEESVLRELHIIMDRMLGRS